MDDMVPIPENDQNPPMKATIISNIIALGGKRIKGIESVGFGGCPWVQFLCQSYLLEEFAIIDKIRGAVQGGGWCNDVPSCLERAKTRRGSTRFMTKWEVFSGILSNNASLNPGTSPPYYTS